MSNTFEAKPGFCPNCGSILPLLREIGGVRCFSCQTEYGADVFQNMRFKYTIPFNSLDTYKDSTELKKIRKKTGISSENTTAEGPVVERKCSKCGNDKMSYATLQLRSADEGQTVFYTCTVCKFKETENS